MNNNERTIQEYQAQSKAAKDELVRLQTERDNELRAVTDRAARLNECAWRDYYENMSMLKADRRAAMGKMKIYLDTTSDSDEQRAQRIAAHNADMENIERCLAHSRAEYNRRVREIADQRKQERMAVCRRYDIQISDQTAIIRALRDAYLKRIKY